ncbi:hypothetical protein SDC9_139156 [bioreactor metagenome]|uniref:Uncharacterized protein n=1 Tax=bioreactor metagenome TaxID=1076179 RepID=A0A645DUJ1_9ZZZZ
MIMGMASFMTMVVTMGMTFPFMSKVIVVIMFMVMMVMSVLSISMMVSMTIPLLMAFTTVAVVMIM